MTDTKLKFQGAAIERWEYSHRRDVCNWLNATFGLTTPESWFIDQDYDLVTLVMREDIFALYSLKYES